MSEFNADQRKELEGFINSAIEIGTRSASAYTNSRVKAAIEEERNRLANIFETCQPVTKDEAPDLGATLRKLGHAIRTGLHD
jgi:hypothetical protein